MSAVGDDGKAAEVEQLLADLQQQVAAGRPWAIALLETIARWPLPEEAVADRQYRYLVGGEAFDWLLLAERLCDTLGDLVPEEEQQALVFFGRLPLELTEDEFRRLIGYPKYRAHLNFVYGVILEEVLQLVAEEDIAKEQLSRVWENHRSVGDEAFRRVYGRSRQELLSAFRQGSGLPQASDMSLAELKEFTYWLFKYRLRYCDPARVASDTRRAMAMLQRLEVCRTRAVAGYIQEPPSVIEVP
jgi:hypothetical protein